MHSVAIRLLLVIFLHFQVAGVSLQEGVQLRFQILFRGLWCTGLEIYARACFEADRLLPCQFGPFIDVDTLICSTVNLMDFDSQSLEAPCFSQYVYGTCVFMYVRQVWLIFVAEILISRAAKSRSVVLHRTLMYGFLHPEMWSATTVYFRS
jgi:hypothetical protein